ncbi:hypothetical protein Gpo141_00002284 [Globisporangium polare]
MKTSAATVAATALLAAALQHGHPAADARLIVNVAMETRESCRGVQQLHDLLLGADKDDTWTLLETCVHPLLFLPYKWVDSTQAVAYCKSEACVEAVRRLQKLPACTWQQIPSDAENELLIAQRTVEDCGQ